MAEERTAEETGDREPLLLGSHGHYFFDRNADERQRLDQQFHVMREDFTLWFDRTLRLGGLSTDPARAGWSLLDVGCGEGQYALDVVRRYPKVRVVGTDVNPEGIAAATRAASALPRVRFLVHDSREPMPTAIRPPGGFDVVLGWFFLYFMPDPRRVLEDIAAALGRHGVLLMLNVPENLVSHPDPTVRELVDALVEAARRARMFEVARDIGGWLRELGFEEVSTLPLVNSVAGATALGQRWWAVVLGVLAGARRAVVEVSGIMAGDEFDRKLESVAGRSFVDRPGETRFLLTMGRKAGGGP